MATPAQRGALRGMLMGSAAMTALLLAGGRGAYAGCTVDPSDVGTVRCTGDVSGGIPGGPILTDLYQSLQVYDVTTDIVPTTGTAGILFTHNGSNGDPITANVDLSETGGGRHTVTTVNVNGVQIGSQGLGAVTVDFTGDIDTTTTGTFNSALVGLDVYGNSTVSGISTGNISVTSANSSTVNSATVTGLSAVSGGSSGAASLRSDGDVTVVTGAVNAANGSATSGNAYGLVAGGLSAQAISHGAIDISSGDATGGPRSGSSTKYSAVVSHAVGITAMATTGGAEIQSVGDVSVKSGDATFASGSSTVKYSATVEDVTGLRASSIASPINIDSSSDITVSSGNASVSGPGAPAAPFDGNNATVDLTTGIFATVSGSGGDITIEETGDITVTSGNASVLGPDQVDGMGPLPGNGKYAAAVGSTSGIIASGNGGVVDIYNSGDVTVVSGNAIARTYGATATATATVGAAAGIIAEESGGPVAIDSRGNIKVTAGTATTTTAAGGTTAYSGLGYGILGKAGAAEEEAAVVTPAGGITIATTGDIDVAGGRVANAFGASNPLTTSAGILAVSYASTGNTAAAGPTSITVDGAAVTTHGDTVVGVAAYGSVNEVTVKHGGSVMATGANTAAIVVGGQLYASGTDVAGTTSTVDSVASAVNTVEIGKGSSVVSTNGIAILDKETISVPVPAGSPGLPPGGSGAAIGVLDPDTNLVMVTAPNATTVTVAGTVSGSGTAISLGGGDDTVVIEPHYKVTGLVDGGTADTVDTLDLGGKGKDTFDFSKVDGDGTPDGDDQYVGFENFAKIGPSAFKLTGTNAEITALPLLGGKLFVNGSLPNAFIAMSAGTLLGGNGTLGGFDAAAGSTVAPGNSIDTLTVTGNGHFAAGSTFQVEVDSELHHDRLNLGGTLTIDGGTIKVLAKPGDYPKKARITIAQAAGGRTGEFDRVTDNLPDIDFKDSYPDNRVVLSYKQANKTPLSNKDNGPAAAIAAGFAALNFAETLQERGHFTVGHLVPDMSPLTYAEAPKVKDSAFADVGATKSADTVYASTATESHVGPGTWIGGLYDNQDLDDFDSHSAGVAGGIEATFGYPDSASTLGLALGYTHSDVSVQNGSADSDAFHVGLYGSHQEGPLNLSAAIAYSNFNYDLSRRIPLGAGSSDKAKGDANGDGFSASVQASYDVAALLGWSNVSVAPTARLNAVSVDRDSYREHGAGALDLRVDHADIDQVLPAIGLSLGTTYAVGTFLLKPEVQVFYEHMFGDDDIRSHSHLAVAGAGFTDTVSAGDRNRIGLGAGIGMAFTDRISASIRYDGSFGADTQQHRASGAVNVKF